MKNFIVIIECHEAQRGKIYGAFVPDVPGCVATGSSFDQALNRIQEMLMTMFSQCQKAGKPLPQPHNFEDHEREYQAEGETLLSDNVVIAALPFADDVFVQPLNTVQNNTTMVLN